MKPTIRNKLIAGFASVLVLMAAVAGIGAYAVFSLRHSAYDATRVGARLNSMALEIQVHTLEAQQRMENYLVEAKTPGKEQARDSSIGEAAFEVHAIETLATNSIEIAPTSQMRSKFEAIEEAVTQYDQRLGLFVAANKPGVSASEANAAAKAYQDATEDLQESAEDGELAGGDASQKSLEEIDRTSKRSVGLVVGISLLGLALGMVVSYKLARAILVPVEHLKDVAENVSLGNLNVSVHRYSEDEIGDLADSFSRMVTAVKFFRSEAEIVHAEASVQGGGK